MPTLLTLCAVVLAAVEVTNPQITPGCQRFVYGNSSITVMEAENFTVLNGGWSAQSWAHSNVTRFASTVANTFLSRRAFLHAPADATSDAVAVATVDIGTAGAHQVLVRYEAAYRFETPFTVTVEQAGAVLVANVTYGLRATPKVWAFAAGRASSALCGPGLQGECRWPYGATENVVWEGVGVTANLAAGPATVTLRADAAGAAKSAAPLTSRNVDAVLLTPNASDVAMRLEHEGQMLALDGLLTQAGEVFARVHNYGAEALAPLVFPFTYSHSPYFAMHLRLPRADNTSGCTFNGGPLCPALPALAPGATSEWLDVGVAMDTFNHGTWNLPRGNYTVTFGVYADTRSAGSEPFALGSFDAGGAGVGAGGKLQLVVDASTRATRRVRARGAEFNALAVALARQAATPRGTPGGLPPGGRPPARVPVIATTFSRSERSGGGSSAAAPDAAYDTQQKAFEQMYSIAPPWSSFTKEQVVRPFDGTYIDVRDQIKNLTALRESLQTQYVETGLAAAIRVVSIGDEVVLATGAPADFPAWAASRNLSAAGAGCPGGTWAGCVASPGLNTSETNPALFYYSNLFNHDVGLARWRNITRAITAVLPGARVGANFSPTKYFTDERTGRQAVQGYTADVARWVRAFRMGSLTLPWAEDWAWQTPLGSQQMTTLALDVFRAGLRTQSGVAGAGAGAGAPPILMYAMAHFPGNTPTSWARQFWGDIAHGVKLLNLFQFQPSAEGYTCDYVDADGGSYEAVRYHLNCLGAFDDVVADGMAQARGAKAALLMSESADIYYDGAGTHGAEKRALYLALRHAELPVDIVTEDDVEDGELERLGYAALYVTEPHLRASAVPALRRWVEVAGGALFATAGAGMLDERNATSGAFGALLGLDPAVPYALYEGHGTDVDTVGASPAPRPVQYIKQDLPFAPLLDTVLGEAGEPVLCAHGYKAMFALDAAVAAAAGTRVLRRFGSDGSPALVRRALGAGAVTHAAFLPGLAYFAPATPLRPVDRSSSDVGFDHFVPIDFAWSAGALIAAPLAGVAGARPVSVSTPLVESGVIESPNGTAVPLINWTGRDRVAGVNVTLFWNASFSRAALASGGALAYVALPGGLHRFTLDLGIGDAIVLRP
eukprot:g4985.t1